MGIPLVEHPFFFFLEWKPVASDGFFIFSLLSISPVSNFLKFGIGARMPTLTLLLSCPVTISSAALPALIFLFQVPEDCRACWAVTVPTLASAVHLQPAWLWCTDWVTRRCFLLQCLQPAGQELLFEQALQVPRCLVYLESHESLDFCLTEVSSQLAVLS